MLFIGIDDIKSSLFFRTIRRSVASDWGGGCCAGTGVLAMHPDTQLSEAADMMPDHALLVARVRNWSLLFQVGLSGAENLVGENQQAVGDRDDRRRLLAPRLGGDPPELALEEAILLGRSSQAHSVRVPRSHRLLAAGGVTAPILARTPIVAWTNPPHELRCFSE